MTGKDYITKTTSHKLLNLHTHLSDPSSRVPPYPLYMFVSLQLVYTKAERLFRLFQNDLSNHFHREISVLLHWFILSSDTESFEREKAGRMKQRLFQEKGRLPPSPPPPPPCFLYASTSDITLFLPLPLPAKVPTPRPMINTTSEYPPSDTNSFCRTISLRPGSMVLT